MKPEQVLAVVCVLLLAGVTANFAVSASQEKAQAPGYRWPNTDVLENVWPAYTPQELEDNYYAHVLGDVYAGMSDCGSADDAMMLLGTGDRARLYESYETMYRIVDGTVPVDGDEALLISRYYGYLNDPDKAAEFGNVEKYIGEIEAVDTPEEFEDFVATGGSGRFTDVYFSVYVVNSPVNGRTAVAMDYPVSPWYMEGSVFSVLLEERLLCYRAVLDLWFAGAPSKADMYYEDYAYACRLLHGSAAFGSDQYSFDEMLEFFGNYPFAADMGPYRENGCDAYLLDDGYASAVDFLVGLDGYRYARAIAMYHVLMDSAYRLGEEYMNAAECQAVTSYRNAVTFDMLGGCYSMLLGKCYTQAYGDDIRVWLEPLAEEVRTNAKEYFSSLGWLSHQTRQRICDKLDSMIVRTCGPEGEQLDQYDYSSALEAEDLTGLGAMVRDANERIHLEQCQQERGEYWQFSIYPQQCNAYYNPLDNSIILCAAYFEAGHAGTAEERFADAAFSIAHEISHAFDDDGRLFDCQGIYREGWLFTPWEEREFGNRVEALERYLDGFEALPGVPLNGALISDEFTADMAGLAIVMRMVSGTDGFDYDRFFRSFALYLSDVMVLEEYVQFLSYETHPLSMMRVNINMLQLKEFREFYGIEEGDGMYQSYSMNPWRQ